MEIKINKVSLSALKHGQKEILLRNLALDRKVQKSNCKATKALQTKLNKLAELKQQAINKAKAEAVAKKKAAKEAINKLHEQRVLAIIARIKNGGFILRSDLALLYKAMNTELRTICLNVLKDAKNLLLDSVRTFSIDVTMNFERACHKIKDFFFDLSKHSLFRA